MQLRCISKKPARELMARRKNVDKCGIYGIWFEKDLVYIGKTIQPFKKRFQCHKSAMKVDTSALYRGMRQFKKETGGAIICKPLKSFNIGSVLNEDLEKLEMEYIHKLNPKLNAQRNLNKPRTYIDQRRKNI